MNSFSSTHEPTFGNHLCNVYKYYISCVRQLFKWFGVLCSDCNNGISNQITTVNKKMTTHYEILVKCLEENPNLNNNTHTQKNILKSVYGQQMLSSVSFTLVFVNIIIWQCSYKMLPSMLNSCCQTP